MSFGKRIRVLIVEDCRLHARLLCHALERQEGIQVVAVARDGCQALRMTEELVPDVITMDVRMPNMDGYEATRAVMSSRPTPILVVAELSGQHDITALRMLGAGALDILPKPHGLSEWDRIGERLAERIRLLAHTPFGAHRRPPITGASSAPQARGAVAPASRPAVVAIVASTGGPGALLRILGRLPAQLTLPIVFVQHIAPGFGPGLARWLDENCALPVRYVDQQTPLEPPGAYMAPDNRHLLVTVNDGGRHLLTPTSDEPIGSLRPRGDLLLSSVAHVFGHRAVGIVLTGMGDDGARGLAEMRRCGAVTIAQDEGSSVIYGMPKVAAESGAAAQILSLDDMAERILTYGAMP